MADSSKRTDPAAGFTLLELLISIAILGLILAALGGGVRFAGRMWERQEQQIDQVGDFDAARHVLRLLLSAGRNFDGDEHSVRFAGELPRALAHGGLYDIELRVDGDRLVIGWSQHLKGASAMPASEAELARNVSALKLAYYIASDDEVAGWQPTTKDKGKPPSLTMIAVEMTDGRTWPPLIIAPMIEPVP